MSQQEMIESFLLQMGCKIVGDYTFIKEDNGYDYYKGITESTVIVDKYNIPITTKIFNVKSLLWELKYASLQCLLVEQKKMLEAVESGYNNDKIAELGDFSINQGKIYITDFLKFCNTKFKPDEVLTKYIITLCSNAITTLNNEMIKRLDKYQIKLSNAHMDAVNYQNSLNQQTIAEASAAPQQTIVTTQYYDSSSWWNDYSVSYATTKSTMSEAAVNASFAVNASLSSMLESSNAADAGSKTIKEIGSLVDGVIAKFNEDLSELLVYKLNNLFDEEAFKHVKDLEKNPLDLDNWKEPLKTIDPVYYNGIKQIADTYGLTNDLCDYIFNELSTEEYNYYLENKKCDYNSNYFQLFDLLSGNRDDLFNKVSTNLFNYYKKEISNNPKLEKQLKEEISNCTYLIEDNKTNLTNNIKTNHNTYIKNIIKNGIKMLLSFILLYPIYWVHIWLQNMWLHDSQFRASIETTGDKIVAYILYSPIAIISLLLIAFIMSCILDFAKSLFRK